MDQSSIDRINTLYHKSQSVGLTEEEDVYKRQSLWSHLPVSIDDVFGRGQCF